MILMADWLQNWTVILQELALGIDPKPLPRVGTQENDAGSTVALSALIFFFF